MPLLSLILPALLPAAVDGIKGLLNWFTDGAGARPANVEEAIKLMAAETEKLKALAELDRPAPNISNWVADLRASFRYLAAGIIVVTTMTMAAVTIAGWTPYSAALDTLLEMSGSVFSFMFGDRVYLSLKRR